MASFIHYHVPPTFGCECVAQLKKTDIRSGYLRVTIDDELFQPDDRHTPEEANILGELLNIAKDRTGLELPTDIRLIAFSMRHGGDAGIETAVQNVNDKPVLLENYLYLPDDDVSIDRIRVRAREVINTEHALIAFKTKFHRLGLLGSVAIRAHHQLGYPVMTITKGSSELDLSPRGEQVVALPATGVHPLCRTASPGGAMSHQTAVHIERRWDQAIRDPKPINDVVACCRVMLETYKAYRLQYEQWMVDADPIVSRTSTSYLADPYQSNRRRDR